ncbi:flavin reductase family protein [Streptomyces catenulae]|uniref:Flavin reductase family protein n=1 Tax=Streptomyces catenulae TaxID=66875 RepID=A0ABV2Z8P5_9ACTN|nr:flavin reductase family protein [Streptomyces catenulae]
MKSTPTEIDHAAARSVPRAVGPGRMREVMSRFATGVTVLTVGGDHPHAMTANAFSSVSLDPPAVLACVGHGAVMHQALTDAGRFAVNILGAGQEELARHFADRRRTLGAAQFEGVARRPGRHTGAPLLDGAVAWLECELAASHEFGDHTVFIGSVLAAAQEADEDELLFVGGRFGRPATP